MTSKISAYVIAFNEAEKIRPALESLAWVDEIVLVDSHSTDGTTQIAESMGAKIVHVVFQGYGQLRNEAIKACSHNWIFSLDADERCTPEVASEIRKIINAPDAADVYFVPRRNFFMGRWIKHSGWYPNYRQPQLFRKGFMTYEPSPVHEGFLVDSDKPVGFLKNSIWQFPFKNIGEIIRKADKYSTLGAPKIIHKRLGVGGALVHALWSFIKHYFLKLGFLDGSPGVVIAIGNFEGTFYRYLKALEIRQSENWRPPDVHPVHRGKGG